MLLPALLALSLSAQAAPESAPAAKPKIAIVIDDFGLNYKTTPPDDEWMRIGWPMTYAVMPESPRTRKVAEAVKKTSHELIIHFPFDPFQKLDIAKEKATDEDIKKMSGLLVKALNQIPGPVGINNHQSYRATMNRPLMNEFMKLIADKNVYFLDSKVSERTVAYDEAKKAGLKAAKNYIFLEDKGHYNDKPFCVKMLKVAAARAKKHGEAIAIGHHYYRATLDCVTELGPELQKQGFELVHASALAR